MLGRSLIWRGWRLIREKDNGCARFGQGNAFANAAAGTGDEGDLGGERLHRGLLEGLVGLLVKEGGGGRVTGSGITKSKTP